MTPYDLTTRKGCMMAVVDMRQSCRVLVTSIESNASERRLIRRAIRNLRARGCQLADRRAKVMERDAALHEENSRRLREHLQGVGAKLFYCADAINANIQQDVLLDLLNVNPVDRSDVEPADGIVEIVYARALENSAENRNSEWNNSPMFQAAHFHFFKVMDRAPEVRKAMDERLFGRGGLLEFVPKMVLQPDGSLKRMPPPLRIADPAVDGGAGNV